MVAPIVVSSGGALDLSYIPSSFVFSQDGKILQILEDEDTLTLHGVYSYALSTGFDLSTSVLVDSVIREGISNSVSDIDFSPNGMYAYSNNNFYTRIYGKLLVRPYDLTEVDNISWDMFTLDGAVYYNTWNSVKMQFRSDGQMIYVLDDRNLIIAYNVPTAWELSNSVSFYNQPMDMNETFDKCLDFIIGKDKSITFLGLVGSTYKILIYSLPWVEGFEARVLEREITDFDPLIVKPVAIKYNFDETSLFILDADTRKLYEYVL